MKPKTRPDKDKRDSDTVRRVREEFEKRQAERAPLEVGWRLNLRFLQGDQYCEANAAGRIEESENVFYWQEKEVFNHLAPIIETRLAKLSRVRPVMGVMPASSDRDDLYTAKTAGSILQAAHSKLKLDEQIAAATMWSETCGTAFYKVSWDACAGRSLGGGVSEGEACITVCQPFEIFPDSLSAADISGCNSIIQARSMPVAAIHEKWGVDAAAGEDGNALVLEYYERPNKASPSGRLIITAGETLAFSGGLPYINGKDGARDFPFVMQKASEVPGSFYGVSVLERSIPVQRAYNAVKNRKHEFLNRIAMGVLAVEDGSVDVDNLEEEGLSPGKVVVYRAGSNPPVMMDTGRLPPEFTYEEDRLLQEFISVSGVSEIMRSSSLPAGNISGIALQLLIEQDDTRLSAAAQLVKNAIKDVSQHILRLYKQFAETPRLSRITGKDGAIELFYWTKSDLTCDDVYFVTENELSETPAQKRNMVFELLKTGLLHDENGRLSNSARVKVLDALGFGIWENAQDLTELHIKKAVSENERLKEQDIDPSEIDDHETHIAEHIRFMLSADFFKSGGQPNEKRYLKHIRLHKSMAALTQDAGKIIGETNGTSK